MSVTPLTGNYSDMSAFLLHSCTHSSAFLRGSVAWQCPMSSVSVPSDNSAHFTKMSVVLRLAVLSFIFFIAYAAQPGSSLFSFHPLLMTLSVSSLNSVTLLRSWE